jgi:hypothetical protein
MRNFPSASHHTLWLFLSFEALSFQDPVFAVVPFDFLSHLSMYDLEYIVIRCISLTQPASDRMMAERGTNKGFLR